MYKQLKFIILLIFVLAFSKLNYSFENLTIELADSKYLQFNLKESVDILLKIAKNDSIDDETKYEAFERLALYHWKYYENHSFALQYINSADSLDPGNCKTWILLSRIERESGNFKNALSASQKAIELSKKKAEIVESKISYARTVHDLAVNNNSIDVKSLSNTYIYLKDVFELEPLNPEASKIMIGIAILLNDGSSALTAIKRYFHVIDEQTITEYQKPGIIKLTELLPQWNNQQMGIDSVKMLTKALADLRFYKYVKLIIANTNFNVNTKENNEIQDILTYIDYIETIEKEANEYYRKIALGEIKIVDEIKFKKLLKKSRKNLWKKLSTQITNNKKYSEERFKQKTKEIFGAIGFEGNTGNCDKHVLSWGHIVNQEKQIINQYGYKVELIFTQIDFMVSNGFSSWYWENSAIGGWALTDEIIQVREVYVCAQLKDWNFVSDTISKIQRESYLNKNLTENINCDSIKTINVLSKQIEYNYLKSIYEDLLAKGYREIELQLKFLQQVEENDNSSFFAHEGRHSIEKKFMANQKRHWNSTETEYHAKLSELVFSENPLPFFAQMIRSSNNNEGHGLANKKILSVALRWINDNRVKIKGYSENEPALNQIHLLSEEQIRECFRNVDPILKAKN